MPATTAPWSQLRTLARDSLQSSLAKRSLLICGLGLALTLTLTGSPVAGQYFGKNRIQYREFDWQIYHSPHFDVYYNQADEHLLQKLVSFAESAYDELSRDFDHQIQDPTPLIVYETHSAFQQNNIILNGVPEGAQAFASPSRFRMVLPLDIPDPELLALIKHELTHIFQYHILFRGRLGAGLRGSPPTWFMEGMASYFGDDETSSDRIFMIDAVVNDRLPSVESQGGGFFAYRFGHAVFDFIEERWGREGILDFIFEFRNTIGSRVGRAIEQAFNLDAEDFDAEFRRWARKKYLPALLETGEPGDFGRPFRLDNPLIQGQEFSPAASPSGDLVAAITTDKGEVDISLFDTKNRRRIRNLTKGLDIQVREIVGQLATTGREIGSDVAFSPDGNLVAAFGRREAGRSLILIDVLHGGLAKVIDMDIEQQLSPAFSPDGQNVVFSGNRDGHFDIFQLDLETLDIKNLTNDEIYDLAPTFSPDGRWLTYTSIIGEHAQIFRLDMDQPSARFQLTEGEHNNKEAVYSTSGERIYFTSDRSGNDNIYSLDLATGQVQQYTNAVTGCDRATVLPLPEGGERLVYTGYWKGRFDLYTRDVEEPLKEVDPMPVSTAPAVTTELPRFQPDIEVAIDDQNKDDYGGFKFFLDDVENFFGFDSNQLFIGRVILNFSDMLGDRRLLADIAAVDSLSDFNVAYLDLRNRWQKSIRVFDTRFYALFRDRTNGELIRDRVYRLTGAEYSLIYPFSFHRRFEVSAGYFLRKYETFYSVEGTDGVVVPAIFPREDDFPQVSAALVSDTTIFNEWGPISGHRVRLSASFAPDLSSDDEDDLFAFGQGSILTSTVSLDARAYVPLTRRSNLAFRLFASSSDGNVPDVSFVGGLDTVRGFAFREFAGHRAFYANAELRFPLVDQLGFPGIRLEGIRGVLFVDIGGAWFPDIRQFDFYDEENDRLRDGIAAYGWGFTARLFGLALNWDFAKRTNIDISDDFETAFWIGSRF